MLCSHPGKERKKIHAAPQQISCIQVQRPRANPENTTPPRRPTNKPCGYSPGPSDAAIGRSRVPSIGDATRGAVAAAFSRHAVRPCGGGAAGRGIARHLFAKAWGRGGIPCTFWCLFQLHLPLPAIPTRARPRPPPPCCTHAATQARCAHTPAASLSPRLFSSRSRAWCVCVCVLPVSNKWQ
jgi:hypothetical protein